MKFSTTLNHPKIFIAIIFLAMLFCLPMLANGLLLDDYPQRIAMYTAPTSNLFDFFSRGNPLTEAQLQSGILPWWMSEEAKVRFFRPIGELLIHLDYALWPDNFALMHLHSIAWYGVLLTAVASVYKRLLPLRWAAALATLMFALDYGHSAGVAWLCNRNVLVAMTLSMLCLLCHRRDSVRMSIVAVALFACSLAASESALALSGYLLAHELYLTRRSNTTKALRLLPYAVIGLCWIGFWATQGYGVSGPGFYIDIAQQPLLFLEKLVYRAPAYVVSQIAFPPVEVFGALELQTLPRAMQWLAGGYIFALLGLLFWFFRPLLKQLAMARFFALGLVIAALPLVASSPVSRSLWYVSFGAFGLIALYVAHYREAVATFGGNEASLRRAGIFAKTLLALHLLLSPLLFLALPQMATAFDIAMDSETVALPTTDSDPRLLLLASPTYIGSVTFPMLKDQALSYGAAPSRSMPTLTHIRGLVDTEHAFRLRCVSEDTLVVKSEQGFASMATKPYGFSAGHEVVLDDVRITVEQVNADGQPLQIRFSFKPGALSGYKVMRWQAERFVAATLPEIGTSIEIN